MTQVTVSPVGIRRTEFFGWTATVAHQGSIEVQTHNLTMAQNSQETDRYYDGVIDEVKIYNRALSAAEIRFLVGN